MKRKSLLANQKGISTLIETMIAVGISITMVTVYIISIDNAYTVYDRPDIDLEAKSIGLMEKLLNSPGKDAGYGYDWELDPEDSIAIGLATSKTTSYGIIQLDPLAPIAKFSWFDRDGLVPAGTNISFDASSSTCIDSAFITSYSWWFDWDGDINSDPDCFTVVETWSYDPLDSDPHQVLLIVNDSNNLSDYCIHTVQANTFQNPDVNPWSDKPININLGTGENAFKPYDEDSYIIYTRLKEDKNLYLYEIKDKTSFGYAILDLRKIKNLSIIDYDDARTALGFSSSMYSAYNFNISITNTSGEILSYGASFENAEVVASTTRDVLIYHKPKINPSGDAITFFEEIISPYHENGRITVYFFLGGG